MNARDLIARRPVLVFYDEHGGFFDHVAPPEHPPAIAYSRFGHVAPATELCQRPQTQNCCAKWSNTGMSEAL